MRIHSQPISEKIKSARLLTGLSLSLVQLLNCAYIASAQNATVNNNAAPNANVSTNTSGGTNINQQLNNVYDTSYGFGPGIICRTPQILLNGTYGSSNSNLNAFSQNISSGNLQNAASYSGSIAIALPFGSSVIRDCERYAGQIAQDREISSELSLIRACAQLERDKLVINPQKYPLLAKCLDPVASSQEPSPKRPPVSTPQVNQSPQPQPKVLQRFNP